MAGWEENKGPIQKVKVGRFQISIFKKRQWLSARDDYDAEREQSGRTSCVQFSKRNYRTREWENQSIWCDPHELRDLVQALERLNDLEEGQNEVYPSVLASKV